MPSIDLQFKHKPQNMPTNDRSWDKRKVVGEKVNAPTSVSCVFED